MKRVDASKLGHRVIIAGYEGEAGSSVLRKALEGPGLGGVVFFKRNIDSPAALGDLIADLTSRGPSDLAAHFCIDQEGGRVVRLSDPLTVLPPARVIGAANDTSLTHEAGRLVGQELACLGLNLNFAPVLDVDTRADSPIIGDRSYGNNPSTVVEHGLAFARGLESGGVRACAKHFPGHGDAALDSHLELPRVILPRERLETVEMVPFGAWVGAGFEALMTAHIVYPALDPDAMATVSQPIISQLLRDQLGFGGVVFTDDLEMNAALQWSSPVEVAIGSIRAGADALLICKRTDLWCEIAEALAEEAMNDSTFAARLEQSAARLDKLARIPRPPVDKNWLASDDHKRRRDSILERL